MPKNQNDWSNQHFDFLAMISLFGLSLLLLEKTWTSEEQGKYIEELKYLNWSNQQIKLIIRS